MQGLASGHAALIRPRSLQPPQSPQCGVRRKRLVTVAPGSRNHDASPASGPAGRQLMRPLRSQPPEGSTCSDHGDLTIHRGSWGDDVRISLAWSGWGKVIAARRTRLLAGDPSIDLLVFTGVAGAADPALRQWDVVLADAVVQHDMDARPSSTLHAASTEPGPAPTAASLVRLGQTALLEAHSSGEPTDSHSPAAV